MSKTTTPQDAVQCIKSGDRVFIHDTAMDSFRMLHPDDPGLTLGAKHRRAPM